MANKEQIVTLASDIKRSPFPYRFGQPVDNTGPFFVTGPSLTDRVRFTPRLESIQQMMNAVTGRTKLGQSSDGVYDFPDGVDDGRPIDKTYYPASDISEIYEEAKATAETVDAGMSRAKAELAAEKASKAATAAASAASATAAASAEES